MVTAHYSPATKVMHVAFAESIEYQALQAIGEVLQCRAEPCLTSVSALSEVLARMEDEYRRCLRRLVRSGRDDEHLCELRDKTPH